MADPDPLSALQAENARLTALLDTHGIEWRRPPQIPAPPKPAEPSRLSTEDKIALFRRLFRDRTDVCPVRWESKTTGRSGYAPACGNEWRTGVCDKPRIKCSECSNRLLLPLSDEVFHHHLAGDHTVGVYPLLADDTCCFLAVDFDEAEWREDARAFMQSCVELGVPAALEISRSGQGAHAWIFFPPVFANTRDRSLLGSMNRYKDQAWHHFAYFNRSLPEAASRGWEGIFSHPSLPKSRHGGGHWARPLDLVVTKLAPPGTVLVELDRGQLNPSV